MKKILSAMAFVIFAGIFNFCSAKYYDNDSNYVFFGAWGSGGYFHYWYLPSLQVDEYNPPHYQISATEVVIGGKKIISETRACWQSLNLNHYGSENNEIQKTI